MAPACEDDESESSSKNPKVIKKCEFCSVQVRSIVKCKICNFGIHTKCFDVLSKFVNIDKNNWLCKTCKQEQEEIYDNNENQENQNVSSMKRELKILNELNAELKLNNNLLKLKVCEVDKNYEIVFKGQQIQFPIASNTEVPPNTQERHSNRSYSQVVKKDTAVLILEAKSDTTIDINTFKSNINPVDLGPGITNVKSTRSGKIMVECSNKEELDKIKSNLIKSAGQDWQVSTPNKYLPRIKIYNTETTNLNDDQLTKNICEQNNVNCIQAHFKILRKIQYKKSTNLIVELDSELFSKIIKQGFLYVGWRKCLITESFNVIRCFKCSCFGHFSKDCKKSELVCPACSKNHQLKDCPKESLKCINCVNHNVKFKTNFCEKHSSKDATCPVYLKQISAIKARIDYSKI